MIIDMPGLGATGRLSNRWFGTPAISAGLSGAYFGGRLRTLVGVRRDWFLQTTYRKHYNHFTQEEYDHLTPLAVRVIGDASHDSINGGAVLHVSRFLAASFNYAQSQAISSGLGGESIIVGLMRGPSKGDTYDYGLRWLFLGGKLESNWTYYTMTNQNANDTFTAAVRTELAAIFSEVAPSGSDRRSVQSTGYEFETIANIKKDWRLMWNVASGKVALTDRFPLTKGLVARAKAQNILTPETDAFLLTVPEGTPNAGYTKYTSNLVTSYRFSEGRFKGVSVGGGFQYRYKTYRGNFDFDRDGVAERAYTPAYIVINLMFGYRTKIMNRSTTFNLNLNNVLDKAYFKSRSIGSGIWGDERNFRFSIRTQL
jgi:hypothetical protein